MVSWKQVSVSHQLWYGNRQYGLLRIQPFQKLYEDNATGKISDEQFATMSVSLENEQSELKDRIPILEDELENAKIKTEGLQRFIDKVKQVTRPNTLTAEEMQEYFQEHISKKPFLKAKTA